ncbi:MAG TPA: class I SAM-dependent methyltransferase [Anaerolineales bacterium]|nr:class I SAM-dependent methyltransferase [Anaerolineales bacterium]
MGQIFLSPIRTFLETVNNRSYRESVLQSLFPLINNNSRVLDLGCSDGNLASELIKRNTTLQIVGVDVHINPPARITAALYDGNRLPFPVSSFDMVMAVDVLHHVKDIRVVLEEMTRVSKQYLLIKDHVWDGHVLSWLVLSFFDWCTNAPFGIPCAYNFPTMKRWKGYFNSFDLATKMTKQVSHFPLKLNRKYNYVFLLEKVKRRG